VAAVEIQQEETMRLKTTLTLMASLLATAAIAETKEITIASCGGSYQ